MYGPFPYQAPWSHSHHAQPQWSQGCSHSQSQDTTPRYTTNQSSEPQYHHSNWYQHHTQSEPHYTPLPGFAMPGPCQQPALADKSDATRTIESLLHIANPWPDCHDQVTIRHLCQSAHAKDVIVKAMKAALAFGGPHASRAAYLLPYVPADSLAEFVNELKALSNPLTGMGCEDLIPWAKYYLDEANAAKKKRDDAKNAANWDTWCEFAGKSRVAWPAPPDDSVYAYPQFPKDDVQSPKDSPDGWKWLLVPQQPLGYLDNVARWGPF